MKIINNALTKEQHLNILKTFTTNFFPWYLVRGVVSEKEKEKNYQFVHNFYDEHNVKSKHFDLLVPILNILNPAAVIRIKANLSPKTNKIIKREMHVDNYIKNSKTAIYYVNTNNGYTIFKKENKIKSEENKLIIFETNIAHSGTTCTDEDYRIVLNFNYFEI
jgi:hypothetical protein